MALYVYKFGGTSVGTAERIKSVAEKVKKAHDTGDQIVVVVSAMSGETNRLVALAKEMQTQPSDRELDVLLSTGEQVTIALLAMALHNLGCEACSYTGSQVKILTDSSYTKARIREIDDAKIRNALNQGKVV
ncbi:MAG: aspartate kinase, partial [Methylobacter sp.]